MQAARTWTHRQYNPIHPHSRLYRSTRLVWLGSDYLDGRPASRMVGRSVTLWSLLLLLSRFTVHVLAAAMVAVVVSHYQRCVDRSEEITADRSLTRQMCE